jgi:hypothetical protein
MKKLNNSIRFIVVSHKMLKVPANYLSNWYNVSIFIITLLAKRFKFLHPTSFISSTSLYETCLFASHFLGMLFLLLPFIFSLMSLVLSTRVRICLTTLSSIPNIIPLILSYYFPLSLATSCSFSSPLILSLSFLYSFLHFYLLLCSLSW